MNTKQKIMALAALPLAGLLASGGVAAAQTAGAPSGTQVVQQAAARGIADPCPGHGVMSTTGRCPSAAAQRDRALRHLRQRPRASGTGNYGGAHWPRC